MLRSPLISFLLTFLILRQANSILEDDFVILFLAVFLFLLVIIRLYTIFFHILIRVVTCLLYTSRCV